MWCKKHKTFQRKIRLVASIHHPDDMYTCIIGSKALWSRKKICICVHIFYNYLYYENFFSSLNNNEKESYEIVYWHSKQQNQVQSDWCKIPTDGVLISSNQPIFGIPSQAKQICTNLEDSVCTVQVLLFFPIWKKSCHATS